MNIKRVLYTCCFGLCLINFGLISHTVSAQGHHHKAQLTAAFIYQITKFTQWPDALFDATDSTFSICVLGQAEVGLFEYLSELEKKSTRGHGIDVVRLSDKQQLIQRSGNNCKILYATDEQWDGLTELEIKQLSQTTLLVGTSKHFLQKGGMLSLLIVDNKMKIFINLANIDKTPIKLESRLKALAKLI